MRGDSEKGFLLARNLTDAGCPPSMIAKFMALDQDGKAREQLGLLAKHRLTLLKAVHAHQAKVDCLDFLIRSIRDQAH